MWNSGAIDMGKATEAAVERGTYSTQSESNLLFEGRVQRITYPLDGENCASCMLWGLFIVFLMLSIWLVNFGDVAIIAVAPAIDGKMVCSGAFFVSIGTLLAQPWGKAVIAVNIQRITYPVDDSESFRC